jgi:site-specific DNA-methyltransferase (adenine-specific)
MSLPTPYYSEDGITLYCGDCRDILPEFPDKSFDLCLTDPPYPNDTRFANNFSWSDLKQFSRVLFDSVEPGTWLIVDFMRRDVYDWIDSFPEWEFRDMLCAFVINSMARCQFGVDRFTPSLVFAKGNPKVKKIWSNVVQVTRGNASNWWGHPSEKYLDAYSTYISMLSETVVLDPFCGSGTTLVAAKQLGRKAVGIEISEKYCEIAVKRLAQRELFGAQA